MTVEIFHTGSFTVAECTKCGESKALQQTAFVRAWAASHEEKHEKGNEG